MDGWMSEWSYSLSYSEVLTRDKPGAVIHGQTFNMGKPVFGRLCIILDGWLTAAVRMCHTI